MAIRIAPAEDPRLAAVIETVAATGWAAFVTDSERRLVWVSDEFQAFLGIEDAADLGIGLHVVEAALSEPWLRIVDPASARARVEQTFPFLLDNVPGGPAALAERLSEPFRSLVAAIEPRPEPEVWRGRCGYIQAGLEPYDIDILVLKVRDRDGSPIASCAIT